jgi:hypothetical protein
VAPLLVILLAASAQEQLLVIFGVIKLVALVVNMLGSVALVMPQDLAIGVSNVVPCSCARGMESSRYCSKNDRYGV